MSRVIFLLLRRVVLVVEVKKSRRGNSRETATTAICISFNASTKWIRCLN